MHIHTPSNLNFPKHIATNSIKIKYVRTNNIKQANRCTQILKQIQAYANKALIIFLFSFYSSVYSYVQAVFFAVCVPLLGVKHTAMLAISTPDGKRFKPAQRFYYNVCTFLV